jgi:hypothetical protein
MSERNLDQASDIEIQLPKAGEILRIGINEYKGKRFLSIRKWYFRRGEGYQPTKAGITIAPSLLGKLLSALHLIDERLKIDKLLGRICLYRKDP